MICPKCGRTNIENASFCSVCGNPIGGSFPAAGELKKPSTNSNSGLIIAVVVIIVVFIVVIGLAAFAAMRAVDEVVNQEATMSVVDATEIIHPFWTPPSGHTFIQLELKMTNNKTSSKTLEPYYFEVVTNDGSSFDYTSRIAHTVPDSLSPGSTATFSITFAVPIGETPAKVTYQGFLEKKIEAPIDHVNPGTVMITIAVTGASEVGGDFPPDDGKKYVLIEFEMTNNYNVTISLNPYDFELETGNGTIYEYSWWIDYEIPDGLATGATAPMYLGFEIPDSAMPEKLLYSESNLFIEAPIDA